MGKNYQMPAVRVVALLSAGILFAHYFPVSLFYVYCGCWLLLFFLFLLSKTQRHLLFCIATQVLCILVGYTLHRSNIESAIEHRLQTVPLNMPITFYGDIISTPRVQDDQVRFLMNIDSTVAGNISTNRYSKLMIYGKKKNSNEAALEVGSSIVVKGKAGGFPSLRNPGEFNFGRYLELNSIDGIVYADSIRTILARHPITLMGSFFALEKCLYSIYDSLHSNLIANFLKSIVLGNRDYLSKDVEQSFIETGTIHVLAVSGTHIAIVVLIFFALFSTLRISRRGVSLLSIVALFCYMVITGMCPSVVRATIMSSIILLGTCIERRTNIYNSLAVAALILLLFNTNNLFDVGAQLSFSAVISIVYFYPRLTSRVNQLPLGGIVGRWSKSLYKLFAVSLAAQIGTLPFTAYYFGRVSIISFVANLVVVPLSSLIIILGFVELLAAPISMAIASCYSEVTELVSQGMLFIVHSAAEVPFASIPVGTLAPSEALLYFLLLIGISMPKKKITFTLIVLLIAANWYVYSTFFQKDTEKVQTTFFDVGQGDACLLELPHQSRVLIDGGPSWRNSDAGKRTIVPYLQKSGVRRLQYVVITHPHDDHYGGIESVADAVKIDTLVVPSLSSIPKEFQNILTKLKEKGIYIKYAHSGEQLYPDNSVRLYILSPSQNQVERKNLNNTSIVIKLQYGNSTALFTGDAEEKIETMLVLRYGDFLESSLLKVGHHGSETSSSEQFLSFVKPNIAIISVGVNNKFGHPSKEILDRFSKNNITLYRTDVSNACVLFGNSTGGDWNRVEWRK